MEKINASTYKRPLALGNVRARLSKMLLDKQEIRMLLFNILGFLVSRTVVFGFLSPLWAAYLTTFLGTGINFYFGSIAIAIGLFTKSNEISLIRYFIAMGFIVVFNLFLEKFNKKPNALSAALISGSSTLFSGLIFAAINGMSVYFTIVSILESVLVFSLAFIWDKAARVFKGNLQRKLFSSDELISISIFLGAVIAGMQDINLGFISLRGYTCILIILVMGFKGGAAIGSATGVLLGLTLMLSGSFNYYYIAIFSIAGITAGFLRDLGKISSLLGFFVGSLLMIFYLDSELFTFNLLYTFIMSAITFLLLPKSFFVNINAYAGFNKSNLNSAYVDRLKELICCRLNDFSESFSQLGKTFFSLSEKRTSLNQKDVNNLIENVCENICNSCGLKEHCWKINFYNTYQTVFSILAACEKKGKIDNSDIPRDFVDKCLNAYDFIDTTNRMFELYKINLIWHNKLAESRNLVSQQLSGMGKAILNLSQEIDVDVNFMDSLEESIWSELDKKKIGVRSVIVLQNKQGRYEVNLKYKSNIRGGVIKEITSIVSNILGRKMSPDVNKVTLTSLKTLRLIEAQKYKVTSGVARITKSSSLVSGDNYSFMELRDGHCLLALSDGMGSGEKANKESAAAIELLEQFMDSGFEKDIALKMINSVLLLKSSEESFSTLDICVIDLYTGNCEFAKIGAAMTFLIRNKETTIIQSSSLPIGIVSNVDIDITHKKLKDGDYIIMLSDGVSDCSISGKKPEVWIPEILSNYKSNNPQDIADYILTKAKENSKGVISDDMTTLVTRIWERN